MEERYRILSKLGAGGMGEVYLAEDKQLGRKVALKILPPAFSRDAERLSRFQHEARAVSALNHPGILTIYEIGFGERGHYIATEFIEGETLRHRLSGGRLEIREALDIAIQVLNGLVAAHEAGIVHRDIKPENIMIRRDGYVKILDFGLAKPAPGAPAGTPDGATMASLDTAPGMVMGTVRYMSPEQARGLPVDGRSDIFSFGVVIYEMVAGRVPFEGPTSTDTIATILYRDPPPLARFSPDTPAELERILTKTLAKNRDERYQTARDFVIDLKNLRQRMDVAADVLAGEKTVAGWASGATTMSGLHETSIRLGVGTTSGRRRKARGTIDSIAVLPLENAGADPETEYLSDGLTDSIINHLSSLPKLRVMARSTVFRYKGQSADPVRIGMELGVRAVLTGRVLQVGDNLVIKSELVDTGDGSQLWGENFRRKVADIFDIEDEISREISDKLRLKLSGDEKKKLAKRFTQNPEAYQLYLKGRFHWNKRSTAELRRGAEYFEQAIGVDPGYALAYAGLADSYALLSWFYLASSAPSEVMPKAAAAANRALEIDDSLAEAHASVAMVKLMFDWDFAAAETAYQQAIRLNPKYATAHQWYAVLLSAMGRADEGLAEMNLALNIDPLSLIINSALGWLLFFARRHTEAATQLRKALELDADFYPARLILGYVHESTGNYAEALAELQKLRGLGDTAAVLAGIGFAYGASGEAAKAAEVLELLNESGRNRYVPAEARAIVYVALSNNDRAVEWLNRAVEERSSFMPFLGVDPRLDPVRHDPRFAQILRAVRAGSHTLSRPS